MFYSFHLIGSSKLDYIFRRYILENFFMNYIILFAVGYITKSKVKTNSAYYF